MSLPTACINCTRRTPELITYCISPYWEARSIEDGLDLLVVTREPSKEDDKTGILFSDDPHNNLIVQVLNKTPWNWARASLVRCWAQHTTTPADIKLCHEEFWEERKMLANLRPKVILALGPDVAKTLLKSGFTLEKLKQMGVGYTQDGIPVVVMDSPYVHYRTPSEGGKDLRPVLNRSLEMIHRILSGKYERQPEAAYTLLKTLADCSQALEFLQNDCHPVLGFDTEVGLQPEVNFAEKSDRVRYLTTGLCKVERVTNNFHTFVVDHEEWHFQDVYRMLNAACKDAIPIATEGFFDYNLVWWQAGFDIYRRCSNYHDLKLLSWAQNQTNTRNGLEDQCVDHLGWSGWKAAQEELKLKAFAVWKSKLGELEDCDWRHIKWEFPEEFYQYQAKDALATATLFVNHWGDAEGIVRSKFVLNGYRISLEGLKTLSYMSRQGIPVNLSTLEAYRNNNERQSTMWQSWLDAHPITKRVLGDSVNPKSGKQMHKLFEALGLEARHKTPKTQEHQVSQEELLRQSHCEFRGDTLVKHDRSAMERVKAGIADYWHGMLQARLFRDRNSKTNAILNFAQKHTRSELTEEGVKLAWLHAFFRVGKIDSAFQNKGGGGVNTGRVSTTWPSISNLSKELEFRRCFEAPSGYVIAEWDQSAIEPRVFAYLAGEQSWIRVFEMQADPATSKLPEADIYRRGWTDYQHTQGKLHFLPSEVDKGIRDYAKVLILRLCYDSSPQGITDSDGIPLDITEPFALSFWEKYTALQEFAWRTRKRIIEQQGWLDSCSGRRGQYRLYNHYRLLEEHSKLPLWILARRLNMSKTDQEKLRAGMNSQIQGPSSDITLTAIIDILHHIFLHKINWLTPINFVHDSMWALVKESKLEEADRIVNGIMTDPIRLQSWGINIPFPITGNRILRTSLKIGKTQKDMREIR